MKKLISFSVLFILLIESYAQQWVDFRYDYDSLLNVTYGSSVDFNGRNTPLTMDVYLPRCSDPQQISRRPLLLLIHGGAFLAGGKNDANTKALCTTFARRGYVTATIEYRLGFIADDVAWSCNYPFYECIFAADTSEWYRAYYRAVQDAKGALRYLINRNATFRIDTNNVFIAGESAGAFTALGAGLMDTILERPPFTGSLPDLPLPSASALSCGYNTGQVFSGSTIARPDLGSIEGMIEPSTIQYTVKAIGNFYGAMFNDLLQWNTTPVKPAIFSFHQPCDIIVPIDADRIYWGFSWCMTNGYGCSAIANAPRVYGSRYISQWNATNNYGYTIRDEFTSVSFPYNYLFGTGSCVDQANNPCHAYDSFSLRNQQLAQFFSGYITTSPICDTISGIGIGETISDKFNVYPTPASNKLFISFSTNTTGEIALIDATGKCCWRGNVNGEHLLVLDVESYFAGLYAVVFKNKEGIVRTLRWVKM